MSSFSEAVKALKLVKADLDAKNLIVLERETEIALLKTQLSSSSKLEMEEEGTISDLNAFSSSEVESLQKQLETKADDEQLLRVQLMSLEEQISQLQAEAADQLSSSGLGFGDDNDDLLEEAKVKITELEGKIGRLSSLQTLPPPPEPSLQPALDEANAKITQLEADLSLPPPAYNFTPPPPPPPPPIDESAIEKRIVDAVESAKKQTKLDCAKDWGTRMKALKETHAKALEAAGIDSTSTPPISPASSTQSVTDISTFNSDLQSKISELELTVKRKADQELELFSQLDLAVEEAESQSQLSKTLTVQLSTSQVSLIAAEKAKVDAEEGEVKAKADAATGNTMVETLGERIKEMEEFLGEVVVGRERIVELEGLLEVANKSSTSANDGNNDNEKIVDLENQIAILVEDAEPNKGQELIQQQQQSFLIIQEKYELLLQAQENGGMGNKNAVALEEARQMVGTLTATIKDLEVRNQGYTAQVDQVTMENESLSKRLEKLRVESAIKEVKDRDGGNRVTASESEAESAPEAVVAKSLFNEDRFAVLVEKIDALTTVQATVAAAEVDLSPIMIKIDTLASSKSDSQADVNALFAKINEFASYKQDDSQQTSLLNDIKSSLATLLSKADVPSTTPAPAASDYEAMLKLQFENIQSTLLSSFQEQALLLKRFESSPPVSASINFADASQFELEVEQLKAELVREKESNEMELSRLQLEIVSTQKQGGGGVGGEDAMRLLREELDKEKAEKKAIRKAAKFVNENNLKLEKEIASLKQGEASVKRVEEAAIEQTVVESDNSQTTRLASPGTALSAPDRKEAARKKFADDRAALLAKAQAKKEKETKDELEMEVEVEAVDEEEEEKENEELDSKPSAADSAAASPSQSPITVPVISTSTDWIEETQRHPLPPFSLSSPVISHLLGNWTSDPQKLNYLRLWLQCLSEPEKEVPDSFPSGLTLLALKREIRDGFLTLVVPMLQVREGVEVKVFYRKSVEEGDKKIGEEDEDADRSVSDEEDKELFDLKLKVVRGGGKLAKGSTDKTVAAAIAEEEARKAVVEKSRGGGGLADRISQRLASIGKKEVFE